MKNKRYIKLIILIIAFFSLNKNVNAQTIHIKNNGGTINSGSTTITTNNQDLSYDITELVFNMENRKIEIEGWATLHNENNWGGVYSIISIGIGTDSAPPNDFYEVTSYTNKNFFGWHCDWTDPNCANWKNQNLNNGDLANYESKLKCNLNNHYGCLYRDVGFNTSISIESLANEKSEYYLYIMVTATDTKNFNNSNLIVKNGNNAARPNSSNNYVVYNTASNKISKIIKFGVDSKSCKIRTNNGKTDCSSTDSINIITDGYEITVGESSSRLRRVVQGDVWVQKKCGGHGFSSLREIYIDSVNIMTFKEIDSAGYRLKGSSCGKPGWPIQSAQKMYKLKAVGNIKENDWVPASWVAPEKNISFKFKQTDTCNPKIKKVDLTCKIPEKSYDIEFDDPNTKHCDQTFSTKNGRVLVRFTQHGVLKIGLSDMKIKSGMGFGLEANYKNTVTWEILPPGFVISDLLNDADKTKEKQKLIAEINKYYKESELFKKSNSNFYYCETSQDELVYSYNCPNNKIRKLPGTWKAPTATDLVPNNVGGSGAHGTKTVSAKYELTNAWSSLDNIWNDSKNSTGDKAHIYQENSPGIDGYINNGRIYYTFLDDEEGYHKISGYVRGLSALNYENYKNYSNNQYIWQANYNCGIECYQEFYKGRPGLTPLGDNKGFKLSYREINYNEPFPIATGATNIDNFKKYYKGIDENWIIWANVIGSKELGKTNKQEAQQVGMSTIINRIGSTYNKKPDYTITVPKKSIKPLKKLEKNQNANYITNFGYIKDKNGKYLYSAFLEKEAVNIGIVVDRNLDQIFNEVGTCGEKRAETASTATCFCPLTDSDNQCVYNGDIKGAGW